MAQKDLPDGMEAGRGGKGIQRHRVYLQKEKSGGVSGHPLEWRPGKVGLPAGQKWIGMLVLQGTSPFLCLLSSICQ